MVVKKVVLKNDSEKPVPIEVIAEAIVAISEGIRKLRAGPLNDRALILLIQHAAPAVGGRYQNTQLSIKDIKATLEGIESLEREYLKPRKSPKP